MGICPSWEWAGTDPKHLADLIRSLPDPIAERALVDRQLTRDLGNRAAHLDDELHRFSLELRRELPSMLGHRPILSSGENLSKILDTRQSADWIPFPDESSAPNTKDFAIFHHQLEVTRQRDNDWKNFDIRIPG